MIGYSPQSGLPDRQRMKPMFQKTIRAILFSIAVATGGVAATSSSASAGNITVDFSVSGPGYHFSSGRGYRRDRHRDYRYRDHRRRDYRGRGFGRTLYRDRSSYNYRSRSCSPRRALKKARRMGVREARIVRVNRRAIAVKGYRYGEWTKVKFGRGGRCPVVGIRH